MRRNEQIRARELRVIGPEGEQLGILGRNEAIAMAKAAMTGGASMDLDIGKNIELGYMAACFGTPDQQEGFASFKEKRPAKFR